jgi:hypothetical protein
MNKNEIIIARDGIIERVMSLFLFSNEILLIEYTGAIVDNDEFETDFLLFLLKEDERRNEIIQLSVLF